MNAKTPQVLTGKTPAPEKGKASTGCVYRLRPRPAASVTLSEVILDNVVFFIRFPDTSGTMQGQSPGTSSS